MAELGPAPARLYLVRHGHVHNPDELAYGHLPRFPLDAEGRAQAERAAVWLAERDIVAVYRSPLLRARQTAEILRLALGAVPLHTWYDLRESELARVWQGLAWRDIAASQPELFAAFEQAPSTITVGETMVAMAARVRAVCLRAARRYPGGGVALVSHRDPILALRLAVEGRSADDLNHTRCQPGSITTLESAGKTLSFAGYEEP